MEIVFRSHHATVSDRLRGRAVRGLEKLSRRAHGAVDASVRFEEDGRSKVVEFALHVPGRHLVARAEGRFWGPAIASALQQLESQVDSARRTRKEEGRYGVAERRALGG